MPVYEFECPQHDLTVDVHFPVGTAPDEIVLRRVRVPRTIATVTGARPPTGGEQMLAGYKKLEERGQLSARPGSFTPAQIKAAAALPDV